MGLTSTLYTSLSGLNASQQRLDVSGNNIANVNTTAFKGSRTMFQTQLSRTLTTGSAPSTTSGGTNPMQFGLGVNTGTIQKDFTSGSIETTGVKSDIAIEGNGFFVVKDSTGSSTYTRDGSFTLDNSKKLVNSDGRYVQGYSVDKNFSILSGAVSDISIPLGTLSIAEATTETYFSGNLNGDATVATTPGVSASQALWDQNSSAIATGATLLSNLATQDSQAVTLFAVGNSITLQGTKGSRTMPDSTFTVTAAATGDINSGASVSELMGWIQSRMALDTTVTQTPSAGVSIDAAGQIIVTSNLGTDNNPKINLLSDGAVMTPMMWDNNSVRADGSSVYTMFRVYDSLGNPVDVSMTYYMESKATTGNTWRFFVESPEDTDAPFLGTGTITFDTNGRYLSSTGTTVTINRAGLGAVDPITFNIDLSSVMGLTGTSNINMSRANGYSSGTLNDFDISKDGTIVGSFSNGLTRDLGQVVLANFSNPEGLVEVGNNLYEAGPNSGIPSVVPPGTSGSGNLIGGALELSNVDITREFINMMTASTAFSASGKVITTSSQLLNELLSFVR